MARFRYTVRKQSSGYTSSVKFFVYDTKNKGRVSVNASILRESAQAEADALNVSELVPDAATDPRPYEVRRAEAAARYASLKSGS